MSEATEDIPADQVPRTDGSYSFQWAVQPEEIYEPSGSEPPLTDREASMLDTERAYKRAALKENWFQTRFPPDPLGVDGRQALQPQYYDEREKFIDDEIERQARLAKIMLRGPKDEQETEEIFRVIYGEYKPAKLLDVKADAKRIQRGPFSKLRNKDIKDLLKSDDDSFYHQPTRQYGYDGYQGGAFEKVPVNWRDDVLEALNEWGE